MLRAIYGAAASKTFPAHFSDEFAFTLCFCRSSAREIECRNPYETWFNRRKTKIEHICYCCRFAERPNADRKLIWHVRRIAAAGGVNMSCNFRFNESTCSHSDAHGMFNCTTRPTSNIVNCNIQSRICNANAVPRVETTGIVRMCEPQPPNRV